jgi:hypothetical protein
MQRTLNQIAIVSLVMLTTFGCTSMTGQTLGTNIDNKTMTAEVKTKLTADRLQNLGWVDVDTNAGVVYLGGTANTEAQKKRAGEIAAQVDGVKKVVNNIQVSHAPGTASASPGQFAGQHTMTGEVTSVDHSNGQLALKTGHGDLALQFPASALQDIQPGDHVTVQLGIRENR